MYTRILVPVDGSDTAATGLQEALALARRLNSTLVLLHVVDPVPLPLEAMTASVWQELGDDLRIRGQAVLDQARSAALAQGVAAEARLIEGRVERVADTIVDEARSARCELIVMGTHGRRGFSRLMLGSDAERVLHACPVPVLLIRHPESHAAT